MDTKTLQIFKPGTHHAMDGRDTFPSIDLAATAYSPPVRLMAWSASGGWEKVGAP